jgi:hypothetical protein
MPFVAPLTSPGEVQRRAQPKDASAEDDDRLGRVGHGAGAGAGARSALVLYVSTPKAMEIVPGRCDVE